MRPSKPVYLISLLPFGRRLALRIWNRLLMHLAPKQSASTYFGADLDCDVRDMIQATIIHFGAWEPAVSQTLTKFIEPGDTVADIGANIGYYSLLFAKAAGPSGKVIAVEALPKLADVIEQNAARNGVHNIRIVNAAASDSRGEVTLYEAPATNIGMTTMRSDRGFPAAAIVQSLPLNDILTSEELATLRLIKIDIEGAEVPVMRHLIEHIGQFPRLAAIAVEASVADNPEWEMLFERLRGLGFTAYDLHNDYDWLGMLDGRTQEPTPIERLPDSQTDILFTKLPV